MERVKLLDHPIALMMEGGCSKVQDPKGCTDSRPNIASKLGSPVEGEDGWNHKPRDPSREEGSNTGLCQDGGQGNHLRPTRRSVNHGQKVRISVTGGQRT